jgi:putative glutamine amidotransferase
MQILNVWRTGTLMQHIDSRIEHNGPDAPNHQVQVEPDSLLAHIVHPYLDTRSFLTVNTSHHQSVERPGDGLRVVARSAIDNIIEAVEGTSRAQWVLAVQWHPERMLNDPAQRALFESFVHAAREWHQRAARSASDFEVLRSSQS